MHVEHTVFFVKTVGQACGTPPVGIMGIIVMLIEGVGVRITGTSQVGVTVSYMYDVSIQPVGRGPSQG